MRSTPTFRAKAILDEIDNALIRAESHAEIRKLVAEADEMLSRSLSLVLADLGAAEIINNYNNGKNNLYEACQMISQLFQSLNDR